MTHLLKYLLASTLLIGCAASTQNKADSSTSSLVGSEAWSLTFPDGCIISGLASVANTVQCQALGKANLEEASATDLGGKVSALPKADETVGGAFATLSNHNSSFKIAHDDWSMLLVSTRKILTVKRIEERERAYENLPDCPSGEVAINYNACPSGEGDTDACGVATKTCGKALSVGEMCDHDVACQSLSCDIKGVCQQKSRE